MAKQKFVIVIIILFLLIGSVGCIQPAKPSGTSSNNQQTGPNYYTPGSGSPGGAKNPQSGTVGSSTNGTINSTSPYSGALQITSSPIGANVFINDTFRGTTPLIIQNIHNGTYNVTVKMDRYATFNGIALVMAGKTTEIKASLTDAKPIIKLNLIDSSIRHPPCIWAFTGTLANTGDAILYDANVTLEMRPKTTNYEKIKIEKHIGHIYPGNIIPFSFDNIITSCDAGYTATLTAKGTDRKDLSISSDDTMVSATLTL